MFRYLPGIVLVQAVTLTLFWVNLGASLQDMLLRVALPALMFSAVTALWLSMVGKMEAERRNASLREEQASERSRLNREIERARSDVLQQAHSDRTQWMEKVHAERERLVQQTHKQLLQRERSINRRANVKLGLAFMALAGLGVGLVFTQLFTLGLLMMTTAAGAMGGYVLRWRQTKDVLESLRSPSATGGGEPMALPAPEKSTKLPKSAGDEMI